jgi:tRNA A-37 threonylcarbamoyl transferase component Bud32
MVAEEAARPAVPDYVVGERLGAGGFGEVFRARHAVIEREVAIKILHAKYSKDPEAVARFVAEARAVNKISHAGIVEVFDFGELADGRQYCVMELIRGRTLRDVLRERSRLPLAEALPILRGIAEALDAAHAAGIAHRDLKPDNVFVVDGGGVKLIDFGLAKLVDEEAPLTKTGSVFGTPAYMSPEQCRGKRVTTATDAYSLGVVTYQVLVGEPPFGGDALELALHHLNDDAPAPSSRQGELDARVDRVVLALLAKDPAQRPPVLADAIAAIAGDASLPAKPRRPRGKLLAVAGVAVAGVAGWLAWPRSDDCVSPASKLAGIWDARTRAKVAARFAAPHRSDVDGTWRVTSGELDDYAAAWSTQWTAACRADDRKTDPLLYAQRTTCLENALLAMRGITESIATIDVVAYTAGDIGTPFLPVLADCQSTPVLRVQPPAPAPAVRDEVGRLVSDVQLGRIELRTAINAQRPDLVEAGSSKLEAAAKRLDQLGVAEAAYAWFWRAHMLVGAVPDANGMNDELRKQRIALAQDVVSTAIRRATELRNDLYLAGAYLVAVRLAVKQGDRAKVDDAIDKLASALERAGQPRRFSGDLAEERLGIALRRGQLDHARTELENMTRLRTGLDRGYPRMIGERRADLAFASHQLALWLALRRNTLAYTITLWGPDHRTTVLARKSVIEALLRTNDLRGADAEIEALIATEQRIGASETELAAQRQQLLPIAWHVGDHARAEALISQMPDRVEVWRALVNEVLGNGDIELASLLLQHATAPDGTLDWVREYIAFMHADGPALREAARRAIAEHAQEGPGILLLYQDAVDGHDDPMHAAAAEQLAHLQDPQQRAFGNMLVAIAQRRWRAAATAAREALDLRAKQIASLGAMASGRDWDESELLTFLGLALVESGDAKTALEPLERSLALLHDCCSDFHYNAPISQLALARALVATGGDAARARTLAAAARDGFARLGPGRDTDRQAAIRWLESH